MSETKESSRKDDTEEVTLIKGCIHAGETKKARDKLTVTSHQKKVMQTHGLVK